MNTPVSTRRLVIGLGDTGLSCARHLSAQGLNVAVADDRSIPPALHKLRVYCPEVPVYLDGYPSPKELKLPVSELIVSPGVALTHPIIEAYKKVGIPIIGDIELFARAANAPIVAITGSNGKSTVTTLIGLMIKQAGWVARVGGNLGVPALDLLQGPPPDFYVLELSSFQLDTTDSLKTEAAVVLNVSPDHLDRYSSYADYIHAKQRIYQRCRHPVINKDDPASYAGVAFDTEPVGFSLTEGTSGPKCPFQLGADSMHQPCIFHHEDIIIRLSEIKLAGRHHWSNVLAALTLGHSIGLPILAMVEAIKNFKGLPHRCQWVRELDGVAWYNDSKATNVGAVKAAIEGLKPDKPHQLVLIAGGLSKGAEFDELIEPVSHHVRALVLMGQDAPKISRLFESVVAVHHAASMDKAVYRARELAQPGDRVVLAPACASFDMFANFERRGEAFMSIVQGLNA